MSCLVVGLERMAQQPPVKKGKKMKSGRFGVVSITTGTIYTDWLTFNHAALWATENLRHEDWKVYVIREIMVAS